VAGTGWTQGVRNGLEVVELGTPASTCTIALHGAHVLSFAPRGDRDWLWVSEKADFDVGKPLRGGIPICFPWFGPHSSNRDFPQHGFARTRVWHLTRVAEVDGNRLRAELELGPDPATARLFPHAFAARLAVTAGEELELALEVANAGDAAFVYEVALHTYFGVSAVGAITIEGLGEPIRLEGEVNRVYENSGPVTLVDPARARPIRVHSTGARSTVVWNPGALKARTVADMSPEGYRQFVCVETGNVRDQRVTLAPGERHETSVRYVGS